MGPPVLLADGFAHIEIDGRRLALVGMILIGLVTLTATQSLWWSIVPILAGWVVWLATETVLAVFHLKLSLSGAQWRTLFVVWITYGAFYLCRVNIGPARTEIEKTFATKIADRDPNWP